MSPAVLLERVKEMNGVKRPALVPVAIYFTEDQSTAITSAAEEIKVSKSQYVVSLLELDGMFTGNTSKPRKVVVNPRAQTSLFPVYMTQDQKDIVAQRAKLHKLSSTSLVVSVIESMGGFTAPGE